MNNRSILFVIGSLGIGGAERHVVNLAISLKRRGWEPTIFVMSPGGPLTETVQKNAISIVAATEPRWVENISNDRLRARVGLMITAFALWLLLWRSRPQILHFFLPAAYIVGGIVSMFAPVRLRVMSRRSLNHYQNKQPVFGKLERWLHPRMSMILANSMAVKHDLVAEGVAPEKIGLIYNGIDLTTLHPSNDRQTLRQHANIREDALVLSMVANLIPYKGHKDLLQALGAIKNSLPEHWVLQCVGRDDGILEELEAVASRLGIGENVRFLGSRTDIANILTMSDIGLLTSHEEGFSNSVLEGMAASLPMIVTDVGGNAEAVEDGKSGIVVPAHSPESLGKAVLALLPEHRRRELGAQGKIRVLTLFAHETCIDKYEQIYCAMGQSQNVKTASPSA